MLDYHTKTNLSYIEVKKNPEFIDWHTKPKDYKEYPHFYRRYSLENTALEDLKFIGCKTYEKSYSNDKVILRTTPSAGGLYPCEIYLQIRGISGFVSGVYHYEPLNNNITLIHELSNDGVEKYLNINKQKGIIFLISLVHFRTIWKYKERAIRYMLLDLGHQISSVLCALKLINYEYEINFEFDTKSLNEDFTFMNFENFVCSIICSNESTLYEAKKLRTKIPFVLGTDYFEENLFIKDFFNNIDLKNNIFSKIDFFENIGDTKNCILNRRSARNFKKENISLNDYEYILSDVVAFLNTQNIDIYETTHKIVSKESGLYKNDKLLKSGDFSDKSKYLCLEQNIVGNSAFTLYLCTTKKNNIYEKYIFSAMIAHLIYLRCSNKKIGCSGIGAYYDKEICEFFDENTNVMYVVTIGK